MANLTFNIHLPLLRISETHVPFLGGILWKMPFETFDGLTSRAFESHKHAYEQTQPVFFNYEMPAADPSWIDQPSFADIVMEIKLPTNEQEYHNEIIGRYPFNIFQYTHDRLLDIVWETLVLAIPTGQFIQPRHSITFINADDGVRYFKLGEGQTTSMANFRGDADIEYLFMSEAAGIPVDPQLLKQAEHCYPLTNIIHEDPDLDKALSALKASNLPYINRQEQFTICMAALENLIIPEVYKEIREKFSHRIAAILSESQEEYEQNFELARTLYGARNQAIHGQEIKDAGISISHESQQTLSKCIKKIAEKKSENKEFTIEAILANADSRASEKSAARPILQPTQIFNNSSFKLLREKVSVTATFVPDARTVSENKTILLYWSPLIGLETKLSIDIPSFPALLTFFEPNDLISLEDKDIRRDFMGQITMDDRITATFGLSYGLGSDDYFDIRNDNPILAKFESVRNLFVIGLRLAGFKKFIDPELLGNYMYKGSMRYRQASVLRQSIFMKFRKDPMEYFEEKDIVTASGYWNLLAQYDTNASSYDISIMLSLYRRIHENQYMPLISRIGLCFILLERLLGAFRPKDEKVQLEDLVTAAIGENDVSQYFRKRGRTTRKSVAHGYWDPLKGEPDFQNTVQVIDKLIPAFIDNWIKEPNKETAKPKEAFIKSLRKK